MQRKNGYWLNVDIWIVGIEGVRMKQMGACVHALQISYRSKLLRGGCAYFAQTVRILHRENVMPSQLKESAFLFQAKLPQSFVVVVVVALQPPHCPHSFAFAFIALHSQPFCSQASSKLPSPWSG